MDQRAVERKRFTGIRGWLARRFRCFEEITDYRSDFSTKNTDCLFLPDELSAVDTWRRETIEIAALICLFAIIVGGAVVWVWDYKALLIIFSLIGGLFYLFTFCFRLYLTAVSIWKPIFRDEQSDDEDVKDGSLPIYSVLIPLYNESRAIPGLIKSMLNLDWPQEKLDIRFVVDEGDETTLNALKEHALPQCFRVVIVKPDPYLRSKPRVLNAALRGALGEFVTIYDAEDRPERDQLRKAHRIFRWHPEVLCLQARLDYYNENKNILTRWFTAEYVAWFVYTLSALSYLRLPVPLGGTSNHFRVSALKEIGAWDPYNMTEDCDLGMRLYRLKGPESVRIFDSTTFEEASSDLRNWLRQRSRWIKGFLQTFLVHFRYPLQSIRDFGFSGFISFVFFTLGGGIVHLLNIIFWSLFILWLLGRYAFVDQFFPEPLNNLHFITFFFGNLSLILMHVITSIRQKRFITGLLALFIPLYWVLMALAFIRAIFQIIFRPHYWEKTHHEGEKINDT